jgi:hypothetical protein
MSRISREESASAIPFGMQASRPYTASQGHTCAWKRCLSQKAHYSQ